MKNLSFYLGVGAAFVVCTALAAQIDIPHQFTAGTPARAGEVNANFAALTAETNAHDARLTGLEAASATVSAQMICAGTFTFPGPTAIRCVRDSTPDVVEFVSYAQIVAEGWTAISLGGGANDTPVLFNKYTTP